MLAPPRSSDPTDRQREARVITKFDSLFAGHIDMDNIGYAGAAVNERRFSNDELVTGFISTSPTAGNRASGRPASTTRKT
jgi:hypothetical protein